MLVVLFYQHLVVGNILVNSNSNKYMYSVTSPLCVPSFR